MGKEKKNHCIYCYKHKTNKKKVYYIGQHNRPNAARIHKISGIHSNKFTIKILHLYLTQKQANKLEKFEITKHNCVYPNGYNRTNGGKTKQEASKATRKKMSGTRKGKPHSIDHTAKVTKASKKKWRDPKYRKLMAQHLLKQHAKNHNMTLKEWKTANKIETKICICGCYKKFKRKKRSKQKFIHGHNKAYLGHKHSTKSKERIRKNNAMKGKIKEKHHNWIPREPRICICGCKQTFECRIDSKQKFISGHNTRINNPNKRRLRETRTCACGCGQTFKCLLNSKRKYFSGHNMRINSQARKAAFIRWHRKAF